MTVQSSSSVGERGQVIILTALLLPMLIGLGALALDVSYLYGRQQAAQVAADAGAQAGATAMAMGYSKQIARDDATKYASLNGFDNTNSTVQANVPPHNPPALHNYGNTYLQVVIKFNVTPILSGILGLVGLGGTVEAVASEEDVFRNRALLYALDPSASGALSTSGSNACLTVGGGIIVNSTSNTAISTSGGDGCDGRHITGTSISELGGASSGCCSPTPSTMAMAVPNPLSYLKLPQYSSGHWSLPDGTQLNSQTISGSTLGPGVYHGGISLSGGTYTMSPGVYVMDGGGLTLSGGVTITGNGVFIYNSDSASPSSCSPISLSGNGTITLDAPTSGTYRGLVLAQDPSCATMATISGNGAPALNGGFYFPDATVDLSGNGSQSGGLQALIVADKVEASGNGNVYLAKPTIAPILIGTVLVE